MNKRKRIVLPIIGVVVMSFVLLLSLIYIAQRIFVATAEPIEQKLSVVSVASTTTFETIETTRETTVSTTVTTPSETITSTTSTSTTEATIEEATQETTDETIDLSNLYISMDMNLNETTGISKEEFSSLMNNFSYDYNGLFVRNAELIWDLSQEYQINEIFFIGLIGAESEWGSHEAHIATCNYTSIKPAGYLITYSSEYEGLTASASLLYDEYFKEVGTTLYDIAGKYCPDDPETLDIDESQYWINLVYDCMNLVLSDIQSN